MTRRFVLASASPARLKLLRAAGFDPEVVISGVDEDDSAVVAVANHAANLARSKAEAVAARPDVEGALVLGCDSMLEIDGRGFGKPANVDEAARWWQERRGVTGLLHTGHHLVDTTTERRATAVGTTEVRFAQPDDAEIAAYVTSGEPLAVAGAFTIDGRGGLFVEGIVGDHGNVVGVSLPLLRRLLAELGVGVSDLW